MTRDPPVPAPALNPAAIRASLAGLRERPAPSDPSSAGCAVSIVAIIALVFMPVATRAVELPSAVFFWSGVGLFTVALVAGVVGIFGAGFTRRGALIGEVEDAVTELSTDYPNIEPARLRHLAVVILDGWIVSHGPASSTAFDRRAVAERLGDAVEYLVVVERILLETGAIHPCFTDHEDGR